MKPLSDTRLSRLRGRRVRRPSLASLCAPLTIGALALGGSALVATPASAEFATLEGGPPEEGGGACFIFVPQVTAQGGTIYRESEKGAPYKGGLTTIGVAEGEAVVINYREGSYSGECFNETIEWEWSDYQYA
jgi:hypothetical protein